MVHIGGFFMGLKKSHRISNFLLHQIACFCGQYIKKKPLKCLYFSGFHDFSFCKSGATRNRTGDTRIFSNKLINNEMVVYQLDTYIFSFMVNAVEKTKVVFKLILNLSITICIGTYKVLNFLFLFHNGFCYIAQ